MKKLSLKNLKFEASEMLGRSQLKMVFGGYKEGFSDGFFCGTIFTICDSEHTFDFEKFDNCMISWGCN